MSKKAVTHCMRTGQNIYFPVRKMFLAVLAHSLGGDCSKLSLQNKISSQLCPNLSSTLFTFKYNSQKRYQHEFSLRNQKSLKTDLFKLKKIEFINYLLMLP